MAEPGKPRDGAYFTVWSGWTPLVVIRASSMREARELVASEDFLRQVRRGTVFGTLLVPYGAKVWVGLANEHEQQIFKEATDDAADVVWVAQVDGQ